MAAPVKLTREIGLHVHSFTNPYFNQERRTIMVNRKGVFIGAYVPNDLKETLRRRAAAEHRTLSQEITRILTEAVHGRQLPPGMVDRRASPSPPRRRAVDPPERRRRGDLPVGSEPDAVGAVEES
jgi:hypothetical protein